MIKKQIIETFINIDKSKKYTIVLDLVSSLMQKNKNYALIREKLQAKPEIFDDNLLLIVYESIIEYYFEIQANMREYETEERNRIQWSKDILHTREKEEYVQELAEIEKVLLSIEQ